MTATPPHDVTMLLAAIHEGKANAAEALLPVVYDELRGLARRQMAAERSNHTLQPTALVHEAYVKLVGADAPVKWEGRAHFFRAAAQAMRRILVDWARGVAAEKRGGDQVRTPLDDVDVAIAPQSDDLLALDEALTKLEQNDSRMADVVKLRYFAGLSLDETALALGVTIRTVTRDWTAARAWLLREISNGDSTKA
ncbi:MAG: sigma-70 family RNA polymerase sigma factor [Planctomycetes bacterium]|nr:sigma-70 family RNA polymerase sigma factor [Planctomycetota bacterium]MBI3848656.1 sigma-70 family RNA polymerase sigma factor [Planctomycetota bacterium]